MVQTVLTLNSGSSSLKLAAFYGDRVLVRGKADVSVSPWVWQVEKGGEIPLSGNAETLLAEIIALVTPLLEGRQIEAVAHRLVHGGTRFLEPVLITEPIIAQLEELVPLAPLHLPSELAMVKSALLALPEAKHIACFDTAFHATQPRLNTLFALPRDMEAKGIRRYGFHGLSYASIAQTMQAVLPEEELERVIVAHLGSGSSACALLNGESVATSMGFSALDGLMMATRPGRLDAGVLLHLMAEGWGQEDLTTLLYKNSGLKGVSGLSSDMRVLLASSTPEAKEAVALYALRAAEEIARLMVPLGGCDALIFTGGVGENCGTVREAICQYLLPLKPSLEIYVIPTDEEAIMAREAEYVLGGSHD